MRIASNSSLQSLDHINSLANFSPHGHAIVQEPENALLKVKYQLSRLPPEQTKILQNQPIATATPKTKKLPNPSSSLKTEPGV